VILALFGCGAVIPGTGVVPDAPSVCINEVMPRNRAAYILDDTTPDWVELHAAEAVDLTDWTLSDSAGNRWDLAGEVVPAGGFLVLALDGQEGPGHVPFSLSSDGDSIALSDPNGDESVVQFGTVQDDFSVARATDCCVGDDCLGFDYRGTPGLSNTTQPDVEDVGDPITWLASGGTFRYDDDGVADFGWPNTSFDDGSWASGLAPLGYGDPWIATTLSYGADAANKQVTAWFRTQVEIDDPSVVEQLIFDITLDDGAVVWLNGEEALRLNMPDGSDESTHALTSVGDTAESTVVPHLVDASLLVPGSNVIAVEVHQAAPDSSDVTFDLGVRGFVTQ
jgi:hypothetical protein